MEENRRPARLEVMVEADSTVNYAVQQNDVTPLRRVRVTNPGPADLESVRVIITAEPAFAHPWERSLERIAAGETRDLGLIDLLLSHDFLAQQTEAVRGSLAIALWHGEATLVERRVPIDVLAYDQWAGASTLPELLAAFVMPNHPSIDQVLAQARGSLAQWTGDPSFHGYQAKDRQRVLYQVAAIWAAVQERAITYAGLPASFERDGQKVRTPDRIFETGLANCLDLTTLFAACLEQAGLHPLLFVVKGHAFPGVWLTEETFADSIVDDLSALRKRVDLGEMLAFEATLVAAGGRVPFESAVTMGRRHLDDSEAFVLAVDVRRARISRIRPLPVRRPSANEWTPDHETEPLAAPAQVRPPQPDTDLPAPSADGLTPAAAVSAEDRLDRWKRKLLDLSLRNRMLNFQETQGSVPILAPDLAVLENLLVEGKPLEIHPRPQDWRESQRDVEVHRLRTGEDAERAMLLDELQQRRLRCDLTGAELAQRLLTASRTARISLEENGVNTLYLALGMLHWYEENGGTPVRRAPILLIPVELQRRSAQSGFTLRRRDDDAMINITLLEMLRKELGIVISGLDPLPEDEAGVDVRQVLAVVRQAIKEAQGWEVVESAYLGLFSFTKFLMWRDLEVRTEDLKRNKLVSSLIHFPHEPFPRAEMPGDADLDESCNPADTFCPVSADSSQLAAVQAAAAQRSFVLHGPPGTGKSQTITNIIAQALAAGKTVLFVAEKMAALSVVQRRLEAVGLGPFCLEVHSNYANKTDVLAQLDESLRFANQRGSDEWEEQATRLGEARGGLNRYVRALHETRQTGESFYTGLAKLMAMGDGPRVALPTSLLNRVTAADLDRLRERVRALAAAGRAASDPGLHPWRWVHRADWSPQWRDQVAAGLADLTQALSAMVAALGRWAALFGLPEAGWSRRELEVYPQVAKLLLEGAAYPAALLTAPDWSETQATLEQWVGTGRRRDQLRSQLYQRYSPRLLDLDLDHLAAQRAQSAGRWFLPRWLAERHVRGLLQGAAAPGQRIEAAQMDSDLDLARQLKGHERALAAAGERGRNLLGHLWRDGEADWNLVVAAGEWASAVRTVAAELGAGDPLRSQELRRRWAALLAEQGDLFREGGAHAARLTAVIASVSTFIERREHLISLLDLDVEAAWGDTAAPGYCETVGERLTRWQEQVGLLRLWCAYRTERNLAAGLGLEPLVEAYEAGRLVNDQLEEAFERSFYGGWVDLVLGQEEELRRFSRQSFEERIAQFRALDTRFTRLTQQELQARLSARIPRFGGEVSGSSEMGILRRELQKRSRRMALRALFYNIRNLLPRLKPCLLMSPISVAQYLDPSFPPFDLVVFDEASQVATWDAVGAIARGAEAIIVGDPKQLPPTNFFTKMTEGGAELGAEELESILDDCLALEMPELHLRWHYRSRHESLIAFSNYQYYQNRLLSFPSPVEGSGVSLRHVKGVYDRGGTTTNRIEAEAVVAEVVARLTNPETAHQSLGVVTFSAPQQRLVEDLLDEARRRQPEIERYFHADGREAVFVKNLENVQGDERDVILFSICYGPDPNGRISANFGPLNRDGGERRLNVAITRARSEVVVFASLLPDQIDLSRTRALGVQHLRAFLEYAHRGVTALQEQVGFKQDRLAPWSFEQQLCEALIARGHQVQTQVGCSGYRIDLAIVDPDDPGRFLLGIECDGANFRGAKTARDRHVLRESVLCGLGWRLHRVWISDWWNDREAVLEAIEAALAAPSTDPEPLAAAQPQADPVRPDAPSSPSSDPNTPGLMPYRGSQASIPWQDRGLEIYTRGAEGVLMPLIKRIVVDEGPVSIATICQRVAAAWGLQRQTARLQEHVAHLANVVGLRRVVHGDQLFYWPDHLDPATYREFRVPDPVDEERREAADLPPEEIANGALYLLRGQVSMPTDDLVREVGRLFGYGRVGPNVDRFLRAGLAVLVGRGEVEEQGDVLVAKD